MKNVLFLTTALTIILSIFSCSSVADKDEARKAAEAGLQERVDEGGVGVNEWYSALFWNKMDGEKWNDAKSIIENTMGDLRSYSFQSGIVKRKLGWGENSGTYALLTYQTVYKKGKGTEALLIHKGGSDQDFLIAGHQFSSLQLKKTVSAGVRQIPAPSRWPVFPMVVFLLTFGILCLFHPQGVRDYGVGTYEKLGVGWLIWLSGWPLFPEGWIGSQGYLVMVRIAGGVGIAMGVLAGFLAIRG